MAKTPITAGLWAISAMHRKLLIHIKVVSLELFILRREGYSAEGRSYGRHRPDVFSVRSRVCRAPRV
jgi:hypothetical protein